jgi:hypothetical protein
MAVQDTPIIKVARPGYDINTADTRFLTIDSTKNQLKGYLIGGGQATLVRQTGSVENITKVVIQHNLGYQPLFHCWTKEENETKWKEIPYSYVITQSGFSSSIGCGMSRPTDNEIHLTYYHVDSPQPAFTKKFDYKYIIYLEPYKDAWDS